MPGKRTVVLLKNLSWRIASQWDLLGKGSFINDCRYPSNGPQNGWRVIKANGPLKLAKFMLTLCFNAICGLPCITVLFTTLNKRTRLTRSSIHSIRLTLDIADGCRQWNLSLGLFWPPFCLSHLTNVGDQPSPKVAWRHLWMIPKW